MDSADDCTINFCLVNPAYSVNVKTEGEELVISVTKEVPGRYTLAKERSFRKDQIWSVDLWAVLNYIKEDILRDETEMLQRRRR